MLAVSDPVANLVGDVVGVVAGLRESNGVSARVVRTDATAITDRTIASLLGCPAFEVEFSTKRRGTSSTSVPHGLEEDGADEGPRRQVPPNAANVSGALEGGVF
ncbi:MAG TPA: hypothetical protein VK919_06640 [Solirubrobacterales bacterium]|nr:hypothetical protein [Solirubrobacterales bacterium]